MSTTLAPRLRASSLLAVAALLASGSALAQTYYKWESVEMPASTGASCGNGTPYRIFVNRTPKTSKTVVMFEGGGACWAKGPCNGEGGLLGASNPKGVPANYMSSLTMAAFGLVTPFTSRVNPFTSIQTQSWNIIYVPYCTGDVHTGNKTAVYPDADPTKPALTYMHRGARNGEALANWIAQNMPKPDHLLVTGFSAGGAGSTSNYGVLREAIQPKLSTLLADSGPLMQAPRGGQAASLKLHEKIREAWGLDGPDGLVTKLMARYPGYGDANNLGSLTPAMAQVYPQDRFGYAVFQADSIYSDFSYRDFYPEIAAATSASAREPLLLAKWKPEIKAWTDAMKPYPNIGFYVPYKRNLIGSHCLTIVGFGGTAIKEANYRSVETFLDNLISRTGTVIKAYETDPTVQSAGGSGSLWDSIVKALTGG
ncbi:MAG TPA: pectin acetylesterase-family hydrolase [Aquabacterium sp.]|uniref:pectin acetylesterase-family hydrolase n=1 Tax=Aquabacterium sp. TaxID=1872578 RepID=UPI002E36D473|nr:pectin acetylesterase-family hydrolase [Aquabacterium sp.]HEX5373099.1 pectin acetylesterase-family hydrolase [Aquabacterium sp.]